LLTQRGYPTVQGRASEILQFCFEILSWMVQQDVKMVVMACNTSDALALEALRREFNLPILGLILPGARAAVQQGRRIGVIATPATAASNAYRRAILEVEATAQVWQVGCPEFVPLVEQNRLYDPYTAEVARQYLALYYSSESILLFMAVPIIRI
jgi:glutamate racemase